METEDREGENEEEQRPETTQSQGRRWIGRLQR